MKLYSVPRYAAGIASESRLNRVAGWNSAVKSIQLNDLKLFANDRHTTI